MASHSGSSAAIGLSKVAASSSVNTVASRSRPKPVSLFQKLQAVVGVACGQHEAVDAIFLVALEGALELAGGVAEGDARGGDRGIAAPELAGAQPIAVERILEPARERGFAGREDEERDGVDTDLVAGEEHLDPARLVGCVVDVNPAAEHGEVGIVEEREEAAEGIIVGRREGRGKCRAELVEGLATAERGVVVVLEHVARVLGELEQLGLVGLYQQEEAGLGVVVGHGHILSGRFRGRGCRRDCRGASTGRVESAAPSRRSSGCGRDLR